MGLCCFDMAPALGWSGSVFKMKSKKKILPVRHFFCHWVLVVLSPIWQGLHGMPESRRGTAAGVFTLAGQIIVIVPFFAVFFCWMSISVYQAISV